MKLSWKITLRYGLTAAVLLAIAVPLKAHAAEKIQVYDYYIDASKGTELYSVSQLNGNRFDNAVIARQPDGSYARWQEPFHFFGEAESGVLRLLGNDDPEESYVYDIKSESILRKTAYDLSPDGKWGLLERSRYRYMPESKLGSAYIAKFHDYYLKNMTAGTVSVYYSTQTRYGAFWLNRHTLLESGYNVTAKQNVISTYDPSTGQRKELLKGTLYHLDAAAGKLLYVKNEPLRQPWLYDLKTGTSRLLADHSEMDLLFPAPYSKPKRDLPQDLSVKELPVVKIPVVKKYEYNVNVDGMSVDVATVFTKEGKTWIPVKPLAVALGWSVELQDEGNSSYKAADYRYAVTSGAASITLIPTNSFNTGGRLFMTPEELKQLGYGTIILSPLSDH